MIKLATLQRTSDCEDFHGVSRREGLSAEAAATKPNPQDEFVARLKQHDLRAFDVLVDRLTPRLLAAAKRLLRCNEDAADAVQDAFLLAYMSIHKFRGGSTVFTWIYRILINCCLMKLRSQSSRRSVSLESMSAHDCESSRAALDVSDPRPVDTVERNELRLFVHDCIRELPKEFSEIIFLRDIEQLDTVQAAAILGISRAAVKTRLHRARKALRELVESSLDGIQDPRRT